MAMLRFRLYQLRVPSLGRYFLPLPKLADAQLTLLSDHLEGRGFNVRPGSEASRRIASKGMQRIAIDGALGLAGSGDDMLDSLAPVIPALLASRKPGTAKAGADVAALYFSLKRSGTYAELQFFPRMESLRTWTCLRTDGLCGLTPDEALVLRRLLGRASAASRVECVTAKPRKGSRTLQVGRRVYYKSTIPVGEFLSSLRTLDSGGADSASYLPRDSVVSLPGVRVDTRLSADELGEWCLVE